MDYNVFKIIIFFFVMKISIKFAYNLSFLNLLQIKIL